MLYCHDLERRPNVLRDGELSKVVANHLGLDFDLVELLAGVNTNDGSDHLGDDDHVTEVSLDKVGLLVGLGLLLGLAELLDQTHGLALETAVEPSAGTGVDDITELLGGEVEELVKVDTAVRELLEGSLSLQLCGDMKVSLLFHLPTPLQWPVHRVFSIGCRPCRAAAEGVSWIV